MATTVNYEDERFKQVESDKQVALNEVNSMYGSMINDSQKYYQEQIDAVKDYANKQQEIQQAQGDLATSKLEQEKQWAKEDYEKEQRASYVDWQKQSDEYGANAEALASIGMTNTGYADSQQTAMYVAYQNRVATARESYNRAVIEFDHAIKDAQLQNSSALAEIAYNALQTELELSLQGFQYKNSLLQAQLDAKNETEDRYYSKWRDILSQINTENALAEEIRQYNETLAFQKEQARQEQSNWQKEYQLALQESQSKSTHSVQQNTDSVEQDTTSTGNDATNDYGNSADTKAKEDYYFKASSGEDYQPRYINNTRLSKTGVTAGDLGLTGIGKNKNIWKAGDKYYVWEKDSYYDVTEEYKEATSNLAGGAGGGRFG